MVMSIKDRYDKGMQFQDYVKKLLSQAGYLEGQLYSTSGHFEEDYYERLQGLGKQAYTSPDITILNSWDHPEKGMDKRFGIACSRRDARFDRFGNSALTFPYYQLKSLREVQDKMNLPIYITFGRKIESGYAVSITKLRDGDECLQLSDQSTGSKRWADVYYVQDLWSWESFVKHRIDMGDKEPNPNRAKGIPNIT